MPRKRKLSDVGGRCRICLTDDGSMSNMFNEALDSKIKDLAICTDIDIKRDEDLPTIICHICLYKLEMWSEFKEQFIRSNELLLTYLECSDVSDNALQTKKQCVDVLSGQDTSSDASEKNNSKPGMPSLIPLELTNVDSITNQSPLKRMCISEDEPASSKDSFQKFCDVSDTSNSKNALNDKNIDQLQIKQPPVLMRAKLLSSKRSRTTERRKASTKRWVARKKALLAATGEQASDTDSVASDDTQLSPVQKARAKTNADKEAERQKRLLKALKNLETNMTSKYSMKHDSDSLLFSDKDTETRRTRSQKMLQADITQSVTDNPLPKETRIKDDTKKSNSPSRDVLEKDNSSPEVTINVAADSPLKSRIKNGEEGFEPHSLKTELEVGNATYIVTSTLILAEPQIVEKETVNNLPKSSKSLNIDESSQEKNTDIIDAVQLRRIHPISSSGETNGKKSVERCLNIEVEGTELEALKRVQLELASFVEKEMKQKLFGTNTDATKSDKVDRVRRSSYQTLDQQLKNIIEKAIRKNFETSIMSSPNCTSPKTTDQTLTISPAFVKTALKSKKFQPRVIIKRLDIASESKHYKINNVHVLEQPNRKRVSGPFSLTVHKRQSVPPLKYNDYTISILDSDSNMSEEEEEEDDEEEEGEEEEEEEDEEDESLSKKLPSTCNTNTSGSLPGKKSQTNQIGDSASTEDSFSKHSNVSTPTKAPSLPKNLTSVNEEILQSQARTGNIVFPRDKHICVICGQSFSERKDIEAHAKMHKAEAVPPRHNKHKMMRCKRCHEIVEARFVKAHVCHSAKQVYKCYVCNSAFRTEKLLVRHLESHDQSEFSSDNVAKINSKNSSNLSSVDVTIQTSSQSKSDVDKMTVNNLRQESPVESGLADKASKEKVVDSAKLEKPKETYTCFVCDKIFTDEEVLKDHLQKHCDDISEDDQSIGKEQYQCAICGDSMESEEAVEAHVEKHLFDDEDDNPNLITISNDSEKKQTTFSCTQCAEVFNSEMLLEMHMQAHEEEAAIAEWEKQGMRAYEFQCMICDDLFENEEDLSEHLDVHNANAHVCQLCEKPFSSLEDLQKHVATH